MKFSEGSQKFTRLQCFRSVVLHPHKTTSHLAIKAS